MLDVRRLRVLCEVARRGSLSSAAVHLGYTQPAVSRQVAQLEAETGTLLVRRVRQGVVLTDAGRLLVARGQAILAELDDLEAELGALAGLEGGRLRFAAFGSACVSIVPLAIARYRERHPGVELTVTVSDPADSIPRLRAGEFDLVLTNDPHRGGNDAGRPLGLGVDPGAGLGGESSRGIGALELIPLFEDPMYVALPRGHALADSDPLSLADFDNESWMLATPNSCPDSRLLLRACHAAGFEPRIAFQNDDYGVILGFVAAGVGVALIPDMVARGARDDIRVRTLDPPPPPRPISAAVPVGFRAPAVTAMLAILRELSEEWVADSSLLSAVG